MLLVELLDDEAPIAVNRFWKSDVSSLSVPLLDELLDEPESDDVLLEVELSDCARLEIADDRSLP